MNRTRAKRTLTLSLLLCGVGIATVLGLTGFDASTTLSQMATQQRGALLVLALTLTTSALLLFVYLKKWLLPVLQPRWPLVFYSLPLAILVVALTPYTTPPLRHIHDVAAYGMALLAPLYTGLLSSAKVSRRAATIAAAMCVIELIIIGLLFFVPALRDHFFYSQLAHLVSFVIALIAVTYDTKEYD